MRNIEYFMPLRLNMYVRKSRIHYVAATSIHLNIFMILNVNSTRIHWTPASKKNHSESVKHKFDLEKPITFSLDSGIESADAHFQYKNRNDLIIFRLKKCKQKCSELEFSNALLRV